MASDFSIDFRDSSKQNPPSSNWIDNYNPSKLSLLYTLNEIIDNVEQSLQEISANSTYEEVYQNLNNLNNFFTNAEKERITNTINDISLRKAIITTFNNENNNPILDDYYPELIEDGNNNFSNTSICFILDDNI